MSDGWDSIRKENNGEMLKRKLSIGLYCFQIIKVNPRKKVVNQYERIYSGDRKKYFESIHKDDGQTSTYNVCDVDIRVKFWTKKHAIDMLEDFSGRLVRTQITYPILRLMREQLDVFIRRSKPEPELVLYWKQNRITVKYAFIYKKDWDKYKEYIESNNMDVLSRELYWLGRKEYDYDETKFMKWYEVV